MISGKYMKYRGLIYCLFRDICDSIREAFGRKKKDPAGSAISYRRWVNLDQGGGVNLRLPSTSSAKKEKEKKEDSA